MDFGVFGQEFSSSETQSSNMVSIRKQRLRSPSPPPSDGIPELEMIKVRNIHDFSDTRSGQSLEPSSPDHEVEEINSAHRSEEHLVIQAFPVPETVRRTSPLDQVEPRLMSMSSILARSRAAEVWLRPDLNQKPNNLPETMDMLPSTELQLGLGGHTMITALPTVKMHRPGDEMHSHEDEDTGDHGSEDWVVSEGEEHLDVPEIVSSGESSDRSLEARYLDKRETPSVSSRRRGRVHAFKRGNSITLPECRSINKEITHDQRTNYYTNGRPVGGFKRKYNRVKAEEAPGSPSGHYLRSSNVTDAADEGDEPPEEGSLMHSVYSLVMVCGEEGISKEDVLVSLHGQSRPAMLAHTDWEADVKQCLRSRFFAQVQGLYILTKFRRNHPSCSKRKEIKSHSSAESGMEGRKKFKGKLAMGNMRDHEVGGRGSLRAMQEKIEEENGAQDGARRCGLMASVHRKTPWQCPLMAMKDHKLCEHHFKRAEIIKMKARALRKKKNLRFVGGSATT